ncbi:MAG: mechanosensitive ion channel family protein [Candidatus Verstraetearchaeota archaeon]|nr:mechanosensitive ion channel family protein [Candidatus Verstraetearchaeota archaeon]
MAFEIIDISAYLLSLIVFVIGLSATIIIAYVVDHYLHRRIKAIVEGNPGLATSYSFVRRLLLVIIIMIGVSSATFAAFPALGASIASIFVAAGFASVVIGLAAQSTLSNIFAGMTISIFQPIRIDEAVMFRNEFCFVEDIKLMYSVLRTWDNRRLMVPNSILQNEVVVNYTRTDPTKLTPIIVSVSRESDLNKAMQIMVEAAKRHPDCLPIGDLPKAQVMEISESGVTLRLLSRAKDQPTSFAMARDLLRDIKKEFESNGIEIPYPRRYIIMEPKIKQLTEEVLLKPKPRRQSRKKKEEQDAEVDKKREDMNEQGSAG